MKPVRPHLSDRPRWPEGDRRRGKASLEGIVSQVAEMNSVVAGIAQSAWEQATTLKEVSAAADQMDKVTQQNAAMVEETAAAAQGLLDETGTLSSLMTRFDRAPDPATGRPSEALRPALRAPGPSLR